MPVVMAPAVEVTDAARAVMGKDHRAAPVRVIIVRVIVIRVIIIIIGRPVAGEEAPMEVVMVREPNAAVTKAPRVKSAVAIAAAVEDRADGAIAAAMEYGATTAAVKHCGATVEAATAVETSAAVENLRHRHERKRDLAG
jgi:hypothetical protein